MFIGIVHLKLVKIHLAIVKIWNIKMVYCN